MRALLILATLAVVSVTFGSCDDCSAIQNCIGQDLKEKIGRKAQVSDFPAVCMDFKSGIDCISAASTSGCQVQSGAAIASLKNLTHNFCGPDGKLTGCGLDLYNCTQMSLVILNDYKNNNATAACPVVGKFSQCADAIKANKECPPELNQALTDAITTFKEDAALTNCYGPCGAAIANCTYGLSVDISGYSLTNHNWTDFCINAFKARDCMQNLVKNPTVCVGNTEAKVAQLQLDSQVSYLRDYCDANGNPSQCILGLNMCNSDIVAINGQSTIKQQCTAAQKFLECASSLPCEQELSAVVQDMRNQFQNSERAANCPTVGSCNTRLQACEAAAKAKLGPLAQVTKTQAFCNNVTGIINCFDFVRTDPICARENMLVSEFETNMAVDIAPACGAVVGNCMDRIKICDDFEHIIDSINTTVTKDAFCNRTRQGVNCFDTVRTDVNCTVDKVQVTQWENKLRNVIAPLCGGVTMIHIPLVLMVACLLFSIENVLSPLWKRITDF